MCNNDVIIEIHYYVFQRIIDLCSKCGQNASKDSVCQYVLGTLIILNNRQYSE